MVTSQQIQQQRQAIERARAQLESSKPREQSLQERLRSRGIEAQRARTESKEIRGKITQAQQKISSQAKQFELEVAKKAPQYALPEYKAQAVTEARNKIDSQISSLQRDIQDSKGSERGNLVRQLRTLTNLKESLSPEELVLAVESGQAIKIAKSQALLSDPERLRRLKRKEIESQLGMSLTDEAFRDIELQTGQLQQTLSTSALLEAINKPQSRDPLQAIRFQTRTIEIPQTEIETLTKQYSKLGFSTQQAQQLAIESAQKQQSLKVDTPLDKASVVRRALRSQGFPADFTEVEQQFQEGSRIRGEEIARSLSQDLTAFGVPIEEQRIPVKVNIPTFREIALREPSSRVPERSYTFDITPQNLGRTTAETIPFFVPLVKTPRIVSAIGEYAESGASAYRKGTLPQFFQERAVGTAILGLAGLYGAGKVLTRFTRPRLFTRTSFVETGLPKTTQVVVYDPLRKAYRTIKTETGAKIVEKNVGDVFGLTDTGIYKIEETIRKRFGRETPIKIKVTPIKQFTKAEIIESEGLFKILPKRQEKALRPSPTEKLFGREFAEVKALTTSTNREIILSDLFLTGTKTGKTSFLVKGLGKIEQLKPVKVQRTGKITGTAEEIYKDIRRISGEDRPVRIISGVEMFKPLYRREPIQMGRTSSIIVGQPFKSETVFNLQLIQEQLLKAPISRSFKLPKIEKEIIEDYKDFVGVPLSKQSSMVVSGAIPFGLTTPLRIAYAEEFVFLGAPPSMTNKFIVPQVDRALLQSLQPSVAFKQQQKQITKQMQRQQQKQITKQMQRELQALNLDKALLQGLQPSVAFKQQQKQITKQAQRQRLRTRQVQDQLLRPTQTTILRTISRTTPRTTPRTPIPRTIPFSFGTTETRQSKNFKSQLAKAYRVLVRRRGKEQQIGGLLPRGRALTLGQETTLKTLGAKFKIEETEFRTKLKDIPFKLGREFRAFKIQRGKKIPLQNEFIERRRFRLSSKQERREIQRARRRSR